MLKIIFLKGLPASGKSSWAKQYIKENSNVKIVNKDQLRAMLDCSVWSKDNERYIVELRDHIISSSLVRGYSVIVDDTNFAKEHEGNIRQIAAMHEAFYGEHVEFEEKFFDVDVDECVRRDAQRTGSAHVGKKVIYDMHRRYLAKKFVPVAKNPKLPNAIICDLDGTLALTGDRDIYDGSKVHLDIVNEPVKRILERYADTHYIIICSGRSGEYRDISIEWLNRNSIPWNYIYTRKIGDKLKDSIIKQEIYDTHIKDKYNVEFVLDDRKQVKRMWVENGLFVLDCNQLDLEF